MSYLCINIVDIRLIFNFDSPNSRTFVTDCHISDFGINFARIKVRYGIYVKTERRKEV